jgi:ABC-type multidrug transport system fused ATPase/permease subunit
VFNVADYSKTVWRGGVFVEVTLTSGSATRADERRFHLWMAGVFVLIAFGGFTPTYWTRLADGTFHAPPIVHVHGFLLFTWTLFYFLQTAWIASRRTATHQAWGLAGISLFSLLICSIIATQITFLKLDDAHGQGDASRRFSAVVFTGLPLMIGLFAAAIANIRRPEIHKRLMFVLMASMMTPAIARVFLTLMAPAGAADGPPPPFAAVPPGLVATMLIVVAIVYDWRTRGRPHKVYIYGGALVLLQVLLEVPISGTHAWLSAATFLEHLAG